MQTQYGSPGSVSVVFTLPTTTGWDPGTYNNICYEVTQLEATPIQLQIATTGGAYLSPATTLTARTGCVPLSSFRTYSGGWVYYTYAAYGNLSGIFVEAIGSTTADTPFDFCVTNLYPAML